MALLTASKLVRGLRAPRATSRRATLVLILAVAVLGAAGTAFGYWKAGGAGTGSATAATTDAVQLDPGTAVTGLYPGGSTSVSVRVTNGNASSVRLDVLDLDPTRGTAGYAVDAAHAGCSTAVLSYTPQTNTGAGFTVPARTGGVDGSLSLSLAGALSMSLDAANACQGAEFTVYLTTAAP